MSMTVAHAKLNEQRMAWSIETHRGLKHIQRVWEREREESKVESRYVLPAWVAVQVS